MKNILSRNGRLQINVKTAAVFTATLFGTAGWLVASLLWPQFHAFTQKWSPSWFVFFLPIFIWSRRSRAATESLKAVMLGFCAAMLVCLMIVIVWAPTHNR